MEKNFNDVVDDKDLYIKDSQEKEDDNISINSIVSDQPEFDSDTEAPKDVENQEDKIILNHVVKKIKIPGTGLDKPSKYDFIHLTYKCYFKENPEKIIIPQTELKDYMFKMRLPLGIVKAIKFMRKNESSIIKLEPKYGYKKIKFEDIDRFCETEKIKEYNKNNADFNLEELYEQMKTKTLIYEIELFSFIRIYDLTGNKNLMKRILNYGDGIDRPISNSIIIINLKLIIDGETKLDLKNINTKLLEPYITHAEYVIIQSMQKEEICFVEIEKNYFIQNIQNITDKNENILIQELSKINELNKILDPNNTYKRFQYQIELIKFKNNINYIYYKDKQYTKEVLVKGIGNISPWKDALIMLPSEVKINNKIIYSDFVSIGYKNISEFITVIKDTKKKIKQIPQYEEKSQFLVEEEITKLKWDYNIIWDPLDYNFPNVFRKEIIQSLKPLGIIKLNFNLDIKNKMEIEQNYFIFKNKNINYFNEELLKFEKENNIVNIEFTACLLNFEEYVNVFNNNLIKNKVEKITIYKNLANDFFNNKFFIKAKKLNKKMTQAYLKYISLGTPNAEKVAFNKDDKNAQSGDENFFNDNITDITTSKNYDINIDALMKKMNSNLIVILYKLGKKDECFKFCEIFLKLYLSDEKVLYFSYLLNKERGNYEKCKEILNKLLFGYKESGKVNEYKKELEEINTKIIKSQNDHKNYMKKMMKNIASS